MEITLEKIDELNGKIAAHVTEADYADRVNEELKKIGKTHVIPGFRKGHINIAQLRQRFGKQVKSDVINDVVYKDVYKYIVDNKLNILGQPMPVEVKEINLNDKEYTFEYEVGFGPDIDVKLDKDVKIPFYSIAVSDEMVADQDKMLCERFGTQEPGEEIDAKAVVKGSIMELNADGTVKEGDDAIQVNAGIVAPFLFKAEADKFIGKKVGDKIVFNPYAACEGNEAELSSMLNIDKERAAEVKGDFEMSVAEVIVSKPAEHNQEYFDAVFGADKVHNEEEYTAAVRAMIAGPLGNNSMQLFNRDAHDYLMDTYGNITLPDTFLKKWLLAQNDELNADNIDEEYQKMLPALKWELISGKVQQTLNVEVTEDDLLKRAAFLAQQQLQQYGMYNMDEETINDMAKRILADNTYRRNIANEMEELKMFAMMRAAINPEMKEVSLDEFRKLAAKE